MLTLALIPLAKIAVVGLAAHVVEHRLELAGHANKVVLVKIATYVLCAGIVMIEWRTMFWAAGAMFDLNTGL
jgi:hypothetical protein